MQKMKMIRRIICFLLISCLVLQDSIPSVRAAQGDAEQQNNSEQISATENDKSGSDTVSSGDISLPEVLCELTENRGIYSKEYLLSDNSIEVQVFPEPVHFESENGILEEIDNGLVEAEDGLQNVANSYEMTICDEGINMGEVTVEEEDYKVAWRLVSESALTSKVNENVVTFDGYESGVSVAYSAVGDGVKEDIHLPNSECARSYVFAVYAKGLQVTLEDSNEIYFYDKQSNEAVFYFPRPFLIDANGEISYSARYELFTELPKEQKEGTTEGEDETGSCDGNDEEPVIQENMQQQEEDCVYVKISVDEDWFSNAVFPAVLDPILKRYRRNDVLDYGCVDSNGGVTDTLYTGKHNGITYRSFVRFNLPALPKQSVVTEALLYLNGEAVDDDTYYLTARKVTGDWKNKDVNSNADTLNWSFAQNQCDEKILDYTIYAGKFDITRLVREWLSGESENYGIAFVAYNEQIAKRVITDLKRGDGPYLKLTYRTNKGLESYWGYHETAAGTAGKGYIGDYTGALTVVNEDVATAGLRLPMSISHIYNSVDADSSNGWRINYQKTIRVPVDSADVTTYPYVYTDEDGTEHYFKRGTVTYLNNGVEKGGSTSSDVPSAEDEDGLGLYIVQDIDTKYKDQYPLKLVNKSGSVVEYYDVYGRLGMITDSNQYENKTDDTSTKKKNKLVITYESAGATATTASFYDALSKASAFKTLCEQSTTTTNSAEYVAARNELEATINSLKTDPYTTCNYPLAKLVQETSSLMDELTESLTTISRSTASIKATSMYNKMNSCVSKVNALPAPYPSRIASITDAVNNVAIFHYSSVDGALESIEDPTYELGENGRRKSVSFTYSDAGDLTQITYPNGNHANYTYTNHLLTSQTDQDGYCVEYTYTEAEKRVKQVAESCNGENGATYGITYNPGNYTTYRFSGKNEIYNDADDIENIYVFDEKGRTLCAYSKKVGEDKIIGANAVTYEEETESNNALRNRIKDSAVVGLHANNLLKNHSFEYTDDTVWTANVGDGNAVDNSVITKKSTSKKYMGYYSAYYRLANCTTGGKARLSQNVTLNAGTYTLSGYCGAGNVASAEAYLRVNDGAVTLSESDHITQDTDVEFDDGWVRLETSFTLDSTTTVTVSLVTDCGNTPGAGWVAFDCIQLEEGAIANDYNIFEDGSFELTEGNIPYQWTTKSLTSTERADSYERVSDQHADGNHSYCITGEPGKGKYLRTTAHLGYETAAYAISGWVKVDSTPARGDRKFELEVYYTYEDDGSTVESRRKQKLDTYTQGWQYFCMLIPARQWKDIRISFYYNDLIGKAYVDGLQITKNDVQSRSYNSAGKLTSVSTKLKSEKYNYDDYKRLHIQTTSYGETLRYSYAGNNEINSISSDVGPNVYYNYDAYGNVTWTHTYNPDATTIKRIYTETTYTADGNFVNSEMDNAGNITNYNYNTVTGLLLSVVLPERVAGSNPVETIYTYNDKRLPASVTQGNRSVSYTYGAFDDLEKITRNGLAYKYNHDGFGNITSVSIVDAQQTEDTEEAAGYTLCENTYEINNGRLLTTTFANGAVLSSDYDVYGHLTEQQLNGVSQIEYTYDNNGNVVKQRDLVANTTSKFQYDQTGNVVRTQVYNGDSTAASDLESRLQYTYVQGGKLGTLSCQEKGESIRTFKYEYAKDGLPTKSSLPDGSIQTYAYDALRRNTKNILAPKSGATDSKKLYATMTYVDGVALRVNNQNKSGATTLLNTYINKFGNSGSAVSSYTYTYDNWGNITNIKDKNNRNRSYTYNDYGEIVSASESYGNGTTKSYTYTYDNGGNITQETISGVTHSYTYGDAVWKDLLTAYDGKTISYSAGGYPVNYMGDTMTWDATGKLSGIVGGGNSTTSLASGATVTYTYYADGKRKTKTAGGKTTTYHYNNGMLLSETTTDDNATNPELTKQTIHYYYDSTGTVLSISYKAGSASEKSYFFAYNGQGDVTAVYRSSDSQLIGTYDYDLWGRLISVTESSAGIDTDGILVKNPIRYRGYHYDNETGFYYLNARYYDPAVRRFISADDAVCLGADGTLDSYNLFAYCDNNAVMGRDDSGYFNDKWVCVGTAIIATGAILLLAAATVLTGGVCAIAVAAGIGMTYTGCVTTYAAATDTQAVYDISMAVPRGPLIYEKIGVSYVADFKKSEINRYSHIGAGVGLNNGITTASGLVSNYENPQDYSGNFIDFFAGMNLGGDVCFDPEKSYFNSPRANSATFSFGPNWGIGYDYFFDPEHVMDLNKFN